MKTLPILFALAGLCSCHALAADRPSRGHMKGMEHYSWKDDGKWVFALLTGTNRLKTESEVKDRQNRIESIAALRNRFKQLAEGEHVVWNFKFVPGFAYPDEKISAEIVAAAKAARINLVQGPRE